MPSVGMVGALRGVNFEKPIVFISYAGDELALADFVRNILLRWTENKIEAFVAKRDIPSGDNPLKVMMEEKLKSAKAIIPICSIKSKSAPWVWWESSAVWARGNKIYPLFTNILANDFGAPLTLVSQGKEYFIKDEFINALQTACSDLGVKQVAVDLREEEITQHLKLREEYSKIETSAKIEVNYTKLQMSSDLHKYSFVLDVENRTQRKFDDIIAEILFPVEYLEKKSWAYSHLRSETFRDNPGYIGLIFTYSGLSENAKTQFGNGLLPGKKLRIFGEGGITNLVYEMDHDRWTQRFQYEIHWKVYINGNAPLEGSIPLNEIQFF